MVRLSSVVYSFHLAQFSLPDWTPVVPRLVSSLANYAFPYGGLVDLGRAIFRAMRFCIIATYCVRFVLGSYIAVFLTLIVLL